MLLSVLLSFFLAQVTSTAQQPPAKDFSTYVLGSGDKLQVSVLDLPELSDRSVVIDNRGYITLPTVGSLMAAGFTPIQVELEIESKLKRLLVNPDAAVSLLEMHSQPISVLGAVRSPGVLQLQGDKMLVQVLSLAGGLADDAGYQIRITRKLKWGRIPLANAEDDSTGQYSVAWVRADDVLTGAKPSDNILVMPEDVISVPKGKVIYVIGGVHKPGGFVLSEKDNISAVRLLALALGLDKTASGKNAKIIRPVPGTIDRKEIPINLSRVLSGKDSDMLLEAEDILFVPTSTLKTVGYSALTGASSSGPSSMLYRIP